MSNQSNNFLNNNKFEFRKDIRVFIPYILPFLLIYSRSIADITIVLISSLFLYKSIKEKNWEWVKNKWFIFALIFWLYCIIINSYLSIAPLESLSYSIFFIRWPLFAIALAYWIFKDLKDLKRFLFSMTIVLLFIIFDTWWQFFFTKDLFGFEPWSPERLTGPFKGNPHVGAWLAKLALLPPLILVIYNHFKLSINQNFLIFLSFVTATILFLTIFISGERMALLLILACIIFYFGGLISDNKISKYKVFIILILTVLCIGIFANLFPESAQRAIFSTIDKITNWKTSDYGLVWKSAYDVWMQSPFFGAGLHKYREACVNLGIYGTSHLNAIGGGVCFHPHNISLELLSETGIFGFLLFYLMVISLLISNLKNYFLKRDWLSFSLIFSVLFTCFLPIASSTSFFSNKYGAIIWLLVGTMLSINKITGNLIISNNKNNISLEV
jgi:O-antigen ligase